MASSKKPQRGELPERLNSFLRQAARPGQVLLLGLSGGLDSCVLLHLLVEARTALGFQLRALHVNHGISPHAGAWENFCAGLCDGSAVPFSSIRVTVPRDSGLGLEAAARRERYQALLSRETDAVVLAHHRDDQAETILLQLLRGAGIKGLAGMGEQQLADVARPGKTILRPLLDVPRRELEAYARAHGLRWIEDESNLDLAYDRNFLRHHVFPELEKRFPAARTTLARSAEHMAEADALLDEVAREDAGRWIRQGRLQVAGLRELSGPRARNLLRYWLGGFTSLAPNTRRLHEVHRQLLDARPDSQPCIRLEGGSVHRYRGEAYVETAVAMPQGYRIHWNGESEMQLPGGVLAFRQLQGTGLSLKRAMGNLQIRSRTGGERLRPDCRRPTRSLRHLMQEAGVPPWERTMLPLLYVRDELVAVPGIGTACGFQAEAGEEGLLVEWRRG
jgi:tRNA(Ile)-lysidine synthase